MSIQLKAALGTAKRKGNLLFGRIAIVLCALLLTFSGIPAIAIGEAVDDAEASDTAITASDTDALSDEELKKKKKLEQELLEAEEPAVEAEDSDAIEELESTEDSGEAEETEKAESETTNEPSDDAPTAGNIIDKTLPEVEEVEAIQMQENAVAQAPAPMADVKMESLYVVVAEGYSSIPCPMWPGDSLVLKTSVMPRNTTDQRVEWSSSDNNIVSITSGASTSNPTITAHKPGEASIIARALDGSGVTGTFEVHVRFTKTTAINLSKKSLTMKPGESTTVDVSLEPSDRVDTMDRNIAWTIRRSEDNAWDPKYVTVTPSETNLSATLTANEPGSCILKVIAQNRESGINTYYVTDICEITVEPILAESLTLSKSTLDMKPRETASLTATIKPENVTTNYVKWESASQRIASVNSDGLVTANAPGTTTITARTWDGTGLTATCTVTVLTPVSSISFSPNSLSMKLGGTATLVPSIAPANAADKTVTWSSSDSNTVAVTANGGVTAKKLGTATITATANDGSGVQGTCTITVEPILTESVTLSSNSVNLKKGQSTTLTATVLPDSTTNKTLTWTSSDTNVATVSNGTVTAKEVGTAIVTATAADGSGKKGACTVTVEPILAESVTLTSNSVSVEKGKSATLAATVLPVDATTKTLSWKSSNESVAIVSNGTITAKEIGTTTITATTTDGSNKSATCVVTVTPIRVLGVNIAGNFSHLGVTETRELSALVYPSDADNKAVTWSSSNPDVLSVDANGNLTALAIGSAAIAVTSVDNPSVFASRTFNVDWIPVTKVTLTTPVVVVERGQKVKLVAPLEPANATNQAVSVVSDNNDITYDTGSGYIYGNAVGEATVTVTSLGSLNGAYDTCKVIVVEAVTGVSLSKTSETMRVGQSVDLLANVMPANATDKSVTWSSSNEAVAKVTPTGDWDAKVVAGAIGEATITVTSNYNNSLLATCKITVEATPVSGVTMKGQHEVKLGDVFGPEDLELAVAPIDATDKSVTWTSDNEDVVAVASGDTASPAAASPNGLFVAKGMGEANLTAIANDGSGFSSTCRVIVNPVTATDIQVKPQSVKLKPGETATLGATILPPNVTDDGVTWASSDDNVVTVEQGDFSSVATITAKGYGKALVIAVPNDLSPISAICEVSVPEPGAVPDAPTPEVSEGPDPEPAVEEAPEPQPEQRLVWTAAEPTKQVIPLIRTGDEPLLLAGIGLLALAALIAILTLRSRKAHKH